MKPLRTTLRLLAFRATADELGALGLRELALGLALTWLAGIGRWWDAEDVEPLLRSGVASLFLAAALSLLLMLAAAPLAPRPGSVRRLPVFVFLTAPLAFVYALPVEAFAGDEANRAYHKVALAVVAAWRVALWLFYLVRGCGFGAWRTVLAGLLPLAGVVFLLAVFGLMNGVYELMAGDPDVLESPEAEAYDVVGGIGLVAVNAFPFLLVGWVAAIIWSHRRRPPEPGPAD